MGLADLKITEFDKKISELATRPNATTGLTDEQVKAWWDSSPEELRVKLNALIDALLAITAASQIGITSPHGANIQAVLEYIIAQGSGSMPGNNSVGTAAIQDDAVTPDKLSFDPATQEELNGVVTNLAGADRTIETIMGAYAAAASANTAAGNANTAAGNAQTAASNAQGTANAAIPKNTFEAAWDILVGTGSGACARKAMGSALQYLRVNSGGTDLEYGDILSLAVGNGYDTSTSYNVNESKTITIPLGVNARIVRVNTYNTQNNLYWDSLICNSSTHQYMLTGTATSNIATRVGSGGFSYTSTPTDAWGIYLQSARISGTNLVLTFQNGNSSTRTITAGWYWEAIA